MKANVNVLKNRLAFTIVELLTVMGVIAILLSLLVPALNLVRDHAKEIEQKNQFHSLDVGIELFKTEFGSYPQSTDNAFITGADPIDDSSNYCGANKLAEAMVGLDSLGFHPASALRSDNLNWRDEAGTLTAFDVYHASSDDSAYPAYGETAEENVEARKGPYMDLENASAFEMSAVYNPSVLANFNTSTAYPQFPSLVLCDVYTAKRQSAKKTGMPILYYRARTMYSQQDVDDGIVNDVYYYPDNFNLLDLGMADDSTTRHPLCENGIFDDYDDTLRFENMILNKQVTAIKRPYRAESYILVSAGKDGAYGTADDILNFTKE